MLGLQLNYVSKSCRWCGAWLHGTSSSLAYSHNAIYQLVELYNSIVGRPLCSESVKCQEQCWSLELTVHLVLLVYHLTPWGRVTHICVSNLTIIDSGDDLSPGRRQAIIWINAGILFIRSIVTNFNEISIDIRKFLFKKIYLKMSSVKWRPFCLGLNVLMLI